MARPIASRLFGGIFRQASIAVVCALLCAAFAGAASAQQAPPPPASTSASSSSKSTTQSNQRDMQGMAGMAGMNMDHGQMSSDQMAQHDANQQMVPGHQHMGPHMKMSAKHPATPEDWTKADEVVSDLREGIEKYKDYRVALADGFRPFLP